MIKYLRQKIKDLREERKDCKKEGYWGTVDQLRYETVVYFLQDCIDELRQMEIDGWLKDFEERYDNQSSDRDFTAN